MERGSIIILFFALFLISGINGCSKEGIPTEEISPASTYCLENKGNLTIKTAINGSIERFCVLPDGKECGELAFYKGECIQEDMTQLIEKIENESTLTEFTRSISLNRTETGEESLLIGNRSLFIEKASLTENETGEKFLVYLPWPSGERWTLAQNWHDSEDALDFGSFKPNSAVLAVADGEVIFAEYGYPNDFNIYDLPEDEKEDDLDVQANSVYIKHDNNAYSLYWHMQYESVPPVKVGDNITAGKIIGHEGNTGDSHNAHLHFAVFKTISISPDLELIARPRNSWGFRELDGSNDLTTNSRYTSQNVMH